MAKETSKSQIGKGIRALLTQIDELSRKISRDAGDSKRRRNETIKPVREVTTSSWEAYNYYIRGKEELERLYWPESRKFLEKAVEKDPQFAMAYYDLSMVLSASGHSSQAGSWSLSACISLSSNGK